MAHNALIRAGANWAPDPTVTPAEMQAFDQRQFKSIHEGGGAWIFESAVTLGGAYTVTFNTTGVTIAGESRLNDWKGATCTDGTVAFGHNAVVGFSSNASMAFATGTGLVMASGAALTIQAGVTCTIGAVLAVSGDIDLSGDLNCTGVSFTGDIRITAPTTYSGDDARRIGRTQHLVDAGGTYGNETDTVFFESTDGATHILGLRVSASGGDAAAAEGEELEVHLTRTISTLGRLRINCEVGGIVIDFNSPNTASAYENRGAARFKFDGNRWRLMSYWGDGATPTGDP